MQNITDNARLQQFIERNAHLTRPQKRPHLLEPYKMQILTLREQGFTYDLILEFLKQEGVTCSKAHLCNFVKKHQTETKARVSEKKTGRQTEGQKAMGDASEPSPRKNERAANFWEKSESILKYIQKPLPEGHVQFTDGRLVDVSEAV